MGRFLKIPALLLIAFLTLLPRVMGNPAPAGAPQVVLQHPEAPPEDQVTADMRKRAQRELDKQRQEQMKRDADKLLQLAAELKLYVDQSNQHILSLNVMKKAEEIEKLAKSVREKMKAN
jgi:hypothetical protein